MTENNSSYRNYLLYRASYQFYIEYPWQWLVTFTFQSSKISNDTAENKRLQWTKNLESTEDFNLAYHYVLCRNSGHPHFHLIIFGSSKSGDRTLSNLSPSYWERQWPHHARIKIVTSKRSAAGYVAKHHLISHCQNPEFGFYNRELLKKIRTKKGW